MTPEAVNELAAGMRTGRVSMNECGCPCPDHATACADRNHGRKISARYPPVFPTRGEAYGSGVPCATVTRPMSVLSCCACEGGGLTIIAE
jgi:hypothetical protein